MMSGWKPTTKFTTPIDLGVYDTLVSDVIEEF